MEVTAEVMAEKFLSLMNSKAQQTLSTRNMKKITRHIVMKLLKSSDRKSEK